MKEEKELPYSELTSAICCESLAREHQAQLFNYPKVSGLPIGLLINFRRRKLEWKRLQSNEECFNEEEITEELAPF